MLENTREVTPFGKIFQAAIKKQQKKQQKNKTKQQQQHLTRLTSYFDLFYINHH